MTPRLPFSKPFTRLLPVLVVALLALLAARVLVDWCSSRCSRRPRAGTEAHAIVPSSAPAHAPAANVPLPKPLTLAAVPAPARWTVLAWSNQLPRLDFTIGLDFFAPLGDGPANAAIWFRDFARGDGSRAAEMRDADLMLVQFLGMEQKVFPPDHLLLREAEPWVDQATCRFYPDVWKPAGPDTPIANLLFAVNLAKSWTARGALEQNPERATEDFRRAMRLGRLFMQEDFVEIQHLVGWACVSYGLRGLNDLARRQGDGAMVAATTLALGDYDAMRSIAAQWATELRLDHTVRRAWWGGWSVSIDGELVDRAIAHAQSNPLRCLRTEAILPLVVIEHDGTRAQRDKAAAVLSELARGQDPHLAAMAQWFEQRPYNRREYLSQQN
jgi:hypothetical protein